MKKICPYCQKEFCAKPKERKYCSMQCANISISKKKYENKCIICNQLFFGPKSKKTCSEICFLQHRKNRSNKSKEKNKKQFTCRYEKCCSIFYRNRERNGFCSRSCASKFYIDNGTYDKWKNLSLPKNGKYINCIICSSEVYVEPREVKYKKLCGNSKCKKLYMSNLFSGQGNPSDGKKELKISKIKRIKTLIKRYKVNNAYALSKHKQISKAQKEIFDYLVLNNINLFLNKAIIKGPGRGCFYLADMYCEDNNVIIEYNGDYWHCNQEKYDENYFHQKKGKYAKEIWKEDKEKYEFYIKNGYNVIIVWESYFLNNKTTVLKILKEILLNS